jgi:flagellar biosynthetic protein FliQ
MGADRALSLLDQMLWTAFTVAGPILIAILIVGVLISILQVATQIQEMTLTFVPKLLVAGFLLIFLGSWMVGKITQFAQSLFLAIPSLVN